MIKYRATFLRSMHGDRNSLSDEFWVSQVGPYSQRQCRFCEDRENSRVAHTLDFRGYLNS